MPICTVERLLQEVKVPTRKRDQLSLNSDHTHFIIIRENPIGVSLKDNPARKTPVADSGERQLEKLTDSADSATNRFRNRFEDFLHQETMQPSGNEPQGIGRHVERCFASLSTPPGHVHIRTGHRGWLVFA